MPVIGSQFMLLSFTISRQKSSQGEESQGIVALKEVKVMRVRDSRMKSDCGVRTDSHGEIYRRGRTRVGH